MTHYNVTWEMDVDAPTPQLAAKLAWASMRARYSQANVFTVCNEEGEMTTVDLQEEKEAGR